jgi:hypothetical protein
MTLFLLTTAMFLLIYAVVSTDAFSNPSSSEFGFKAVAKKDIIVCEVTEADREEIALRKNDEPMFTAAVRRDLYNILRNPYEPNKGAPAPLSWWGDDSDVGSSQFGAILLAKNVSAYAFTDRLSYVDMERQPEFTILDDKSVLDAIAKIGQPVPEALAITKAFEAWLSQTAKSWGDVEVSELSVEFLVAFGTELTERLGVNHRILSTILSEEEKLVLRHPPFVSHVRPELVEKFQTKTEVSVDQRDAQMMWWDHEED